MLIDTGFEDFQFNPGKFQKIIENPKYWKTVFKTEIGQFGITKDQIEKSTRIEFPVQTRADSEFTNPNPRQYDHMNNS